MAFLSKISNIRKSLDIRTSRQHGPHELHKGDTDHANRIALMQYLATQVFGGMRSNTSNLETWFDWTMGNMPRTRDEIPVAMSEPPLKCKTATVHFCWTDLFLRLFFLVVQSSPKLCTPKRVSPGPGMLAMPTISLWDDAWWDHCLQPAWNVSLSLSNKFEIVLQASHRLNPLSWPTANSKKELGLWIDLIKPPSAEICQYVPFGSFHQAEALVRTGHL